MHQALVPGDDLAERFRYRAGQFLTFKVPAAGGTPVFAYKGESLEEYWEFTHRIFEWPGGEYANMMVVSSLATVLFFGGWLGPVFGPPLVRAMLPVLWFCLKVFCFLFVYIWIRGTLPRFRYDQLMRFGWKVMLPLASSGAYYVLCKAYIRFGA